MAPSATLPLCVMASGHASAVLGERGVVFKHLLNGNNCFCMGVPMVTCHLDSRSTLGSQAVKKVSLRQ